MSVSLSQVISFTLYNKAAYTSTIIRLLLILVNRFRRLGSETNYVNHVQNYYRIIREGKLFNYKAHSDISFGILSRE